MSLDSIIAVYLDTFSDILAIYQCYKSEKYIVLSNLQ